MHTNDLKHYLPNYDKEERPWGNFELLSLNDETTVKIITVKADEAISLQTHEHRDEFWRVLKASKVPGIVRIGLMDYEALEGKSFFCPRRCLHRISGGSEGTVFLEIAYGKFDENDIKRFEDRYNRK